MARGASFSPGVQRVWLDPCVKSLYQFSARMFDLALRSMQCEIVLFKSEFVYHSLSLPLSLFCTHVGHELLVFSYFGFLVPCLFFFFHFSLERTKQMSSEMQWMSRLMFNSVKEHCLFFGLFLFEKTFRLYIR